MLTNEVLASAKAGNVESIESLLEAAGPVILAKVRRKVGNDHSDDVYQEVLIDILMDLRECRSVDAAGFFGWALRIVDHTVDSYFAKIRTLKRGGNVAHGVIDDFLCANASSTPDEIAIANEALEEVWQLAKSIGESTYTAIYMRANGYSLKDIMSELDKSDVAVRGILKRFNEKARERGLVCC